MRVALFFAASVLVAGCSAGPPGGQRTTELTPLTPSRAAAAPTTAPTTTATGSAPPGGTSAAPAADASIAEVIQWTEAASPTDPADFRVALRGGTATPLGEDVAFTNAAGTTCMTDTRRGSAALACLVDLRDPPAQPADVYGVWKGGWVDFDGSSVQIGSAHGDPGRFAAGQGPPLPPDRSLSFGDFRCRTDPAVLVCVNYARQTAVRYSDDGIESWGCSRQVPPAAGIGIEFRC